VGAAALASVVGHGGARGGGCDAGASREHRRWSVAVVQHWERGGGTRVAEGKSKRQNTKRRRGTLHEGSMAL